MGGITTTTLATLKRDVSVIVEILNAQDNPQLKQEAEIIQKTQFYIEKLIELSRHPDPAESERLNREIEEFNKQHPTAPDDLIRLEPYRDTIKQVADRYNEDKQPCQP